ncbi:MAG: hypothetical protein M1820_003464 [Bogoriella megaspora]|nr:MAG: hypothetical protein M1820_003464 [Bogoriella megaspora]
MEKYQREHLLTPAISPMASFTFARKDKHGRRFPQAIAHRGYKAKYPENTLRAFTGAREVGAHALETDLHLSKDGVVVISHDPSLKRCYGKDHKIIDCDWEYLSTLRTLQEPHEPIPRFKDLLEFLKKADNQHLWVLLDIKTDDDADDMIRLLAKTIEEVEPVKDRPWNKRIVLGCWTPQYPPLCGIHLPSYPIIHIGVSITYARRFFTYPNCSFNMLIFTLAGPFGANFRRQVRTLERAVIGWTVNDKSWMKWAVRKDLDGLITDDPKTYLEVCENWEDEDDKGGTDLMMLVIALWTQVLVFFLARWYLWRKQKGARQRRVKSTVA